jgi:hypothetical protein
MYEIVQKPTREECTRVWSGKVIVQLSPLCFKWAPRHESVLGEWRYSSTHSRPSHYKEVSGQLHAPAALPPGKEPLVPARQEAGWAPEPAWKRWWRKKILIHCRDSNFRSLSPWSSATELSYPGSWIFKYSKMTENKPQPTTYTKIWETKSSYCVSYT